MLHRQFLTSAALAAQPQAAGRPNILFCCTDQQRWDTIAALGNPHIRTPNLDRFAAAGVTATSARTRSALPAGPPL